MSSITPLFAKKDAGSSVPKAVVEFRAGKLSMKSGSKLLIPDKRKGLVQILKGEDQIMHFMWKDRATNTVEDDLIIFPDDIEFKRVPECTTGRVYVLKFKSSSRRLFFWMQEPKENKDGDFCRRVNQWLSKRPSRGGLRRVDNRDSSIGSNEDMEVSSFGEENLDSVLGNMNPEQLMEILERGGLSEAGGPEFASMLQAISSNASNSSQFDSPSSEPRTSNGPNSTSVPSRGVQLSDLQSILSGHKVPKVDDEVPVNLALGVTVEAITPLLKNPDFLEKAKIHLPNTEEDVASNISSTIVSPQFQQSLQLFTTGLQSGQLAPIIREFELGETAVEAAAAGDLKKFIDAVQNEKHNDNQKHSDENGDVDMAE